MLHDRAGFAFLHNENGYKCATLSLHDNHLFLLGHHYDLLIELLKKDGDGQWKVHVELS